MSGSTKARGAGFALCALVLGCALALAVARPASAQGQQGQQGQQPASVTQFLANPGGLLGQYPNTNPTNPTDPLVLAIRDLAAASPDTLTALLGLAANAQPAQKQAIGKGLGLAAAMVLATNPRYANDIQVAVARTRDRQLVLAYTSDAPTGATGGGGGGGATGGAVGGQTNTFGGTPTSTGSAQGIGGGGTQTGAFSISSSVGGTSGINQTVSP